MQRTVIDVLSELLAIIKYPNNKQKFIAEFEEVNEMETLANLLERLPEETQKKLEQLSDSQEIKQYVSAEEYQQELIKVSTEAVQKFIKAISPVLNLEQKEKIVNLVSIVSE